MVERGGRLIRQIENALLEEIKLQVSYAQLIEEEKSYIIKFKPAQITELTEKRGILYRSIAAARDRREALTLELAGEKGGGTLTALLKELAHPEDARRLTAHAEKLRALVQANQNRGREFGRLAHFALTLMGGTISILWSATQSITRGYGRNGVMKESYAPKTRSQSTLKEA